MGLFNLFGKKKEKKDSFAERRVLPRWKIHMPAKITIEGDEKPIECRLMDLNFKGFSISLPNPLIGSCKDMTLLILERYLYNVEVERTWQTEKDGRYYYGFKFTRLRDADREKMHKMMKEDFPQNREIF